MSSQGQIKGSTFSEIGRHARRMLSSGSSGRAIGWVSVLYGINVVLGLVRDMVLAASYGATEQLDALLIAINFMRTTGLLIAIAVAGALIPIYAPIVLENDQRWRDLSARLFKRGVFFFGLAAIFLYLFVVPLSRLLGPGLEQDGLLTLQTALRLLVPLVMILGLAGLTKTITDSFGDYASHPVLLGLMTVGLIVSTLLFAVQLGIQAAAIGLVIGGTAGLLIQLLYIARSYDLSPRQILGPALIRGTASAMPNLPYRAILILIASSFLIQSQGLIERSFMSTLPPGSVVALSLALSVLGVPTTLLLPAASTVLLPYFSRHESSGQLRRFGLKFQQYLMLIIAFGLVTTLYWFAADSLVETLFLRGEFTTEAAALTGWTIRWLSISIVPYVISTVLRQVVLSRQLVAADFAVSSLTLGFKLLFLWLFVGALGFEAIIVAISAAVVFSAGAYGVILRMARPSPA